jgi:hypothetical protein
MGQTVSATIGYGFPLPPDFLKANDYEIDPLLDEGMILAFADTESDDGGMFVIMQKSREEAWGRNGDAVKLPMTALNIFPQWYEQLEEWAQKHNIIHPDIGWWLLASIS